MDYSKLKWLKFCISYCGEWEIENSFSKIIIDWFYVGKFLYPGFFCIWVYVDPFLLNARKKSLNCILSTFIYLLLISIQFPSGILLAEIFTLDIWSFHSLGMHDFYCRHSIKLVINLYLDVSSIWFKKLPLSSKISFIYKIPLSMNCLLYIYALFIFKFSFNHNDLY